MDASNDDIKQQGKSNIEHLDNSKYKIVHLYWIFFMKNHCINSFEDL